MKAFRVDLKACLDLVLSNQYCPIIVWENWGWFSGDFTTWATPTSWSSQLRTTIMVHDMSLWEAKIYTWLRWSEYTVLLVIYVNLRPLTTQETIYCIYLYCIYSRYQTNIWKGFPFLKAKTKTGLNIYFWSCTSTYQHWATLWTSSLDLLIVK